MASLPGPTNSDFDIEAQRAISQIPPVTPSLEQVEDAEGSETHHMGTILLGQSKTKSHSSQEPRPMSTRDQNSDVASEARSAISENEGNEGTQALGVNIRNDEGSNRTTMQAQDQIQTEAQTELERTINTIIEDANDPPPEEPQDREDRMIGDFEGSANALWTIYGKEAKSHDEARFQTLKGDMDGVLIFAGLFSAALTAFVIDSKQNLKPSPSDQMVYYLQQNVAMLNQISHQISSIAPQVSISSTPPPPFPAFNPLASDIRVNVFWFMALIFSLTAALLAILVQQWVRDYMQLFQRYGDPLKSARIRQYLQEGCEGWYMPVIAEAVPGLLHVSLFLFFAGLGDSVLNINTAVGISTTVPIGITGLVYIFTMIAPIIYPQSPYQNSFSGLIWYLMQKLHGRKYRDRNSNGALKSLSSNMAQGQMQLAMEETEARKSRDERAIRWLVGNMTEDAEIELLAMAIPGSFYGEWGVEVWKNIVSSKGDGRRRSQHELVIGPLADSDVATTNPLIVPPTRISTVWNALSSIIRQVRTRAGGDSLAITTITLPVSHPLVTRLDLVSDDIQVYQAMHELGARICHLLDTCKNRGLFASDDLWRQRTRACIETAASLVCCANTKLDWFGDIVPLLGNIGEDQKIRELSEEGKDQSFVMCWTCLSLMVLRLVLERNGTVRKFVEQAIALLEMKDHTGREQAQKIDESFDKAHKCLKQLFERFEDEGNPSMEQVERTLQSHESEISALERINIEVDSDSSLELIDERTDRVHSLIKLYSYRMITQLPGVQFDNLHDIDQTVAVEWCQNYFQVPIVTPGRMLMNICSFASTFRNILQGHWDPDVYQETLKNLTKIVYASPQAWHRNPLQRMLWRLRDLGDGGGLGFTVELFFLSLKKLLFRSSAENSYPAFYIATFRAITSDWSKYKHSLGTQKLLLDMITSDYGLVYYYQYPTYIRHEFLVLLGNVFAGQKGPHIYDALQQLVDLYNRSHGGRKAFVAKALKALTRAHRSPSS